MSSKSNTSTSISTSMDGIKEKIKELEEKKDATNNEEYKESLPIFKKRSAAWAARAYKADPRSAARGRKTKRRKTKRRKSKRRKSKIRKRNN